MPKDWFEIGEAQRQTVIAFLREMKSESDHYRTLFEDALDAAIVRLEPTRPLPPPRLPADPHDDAEAHDAEAYDGYTRPWHDRDWPDY